MNRDLTALLTVTLSGLPGTAVLAVAKGFLGKLLP